MIKPRPASASLGQSAAMFQLAGHTALGLTWLSTGPDGLSQSRPVGGAQQRLCSARRPRPKDAVGAHRVDHHLCVREAEAVRVHRRASRAGHYAACRRRKQTPSVAGGVARWRGVREASGVCELAERGGQRRPCGRMHGTIDVVWPVLEAPVRRRPVAAEARVRARGDGVSCPVRDVSAADTQHGAHAHGEPPVHTCASEPEGADEGVSRAVGMFELQELSLLFVLA